MPILFWIIIVVIVFIVLISIRQINQYEQGVKLMLGKYIGLMNPGWRLVWPIRFSISDTCTGLYIDVRISLFTDG